MSQVVTGRMVSEAYFDGRRTLPLDRLDNIGGISAALFMAGVKTIVGTLWEVESRCAQYFFSFFYERLRQGDAKLEAFHTAQTSAREYYPEYRDCGQGRRGAVWLTRLFLTHRETAARAERESVVLIAGVTDQKLSLTRFDRLGERTASRASRRISPQPAILYGYWLVDSQAAGTCQSR